MTKLGDKDMQAFVIEETVVTPEFQKDILGIYHLIAILTQTSEDFTLPMRQFCFNACIFQTL